MRLLASRARGGLARTVIMSALLLTLVSNARAQSVARIDEQLHTYNSELDQIDQRIDIPTQLGASSKYDSVDDIFAEGMAHFELGSYSDAALLLFGILDSPRARHLHDQALYYLAESLFANRSYFAARSYFVRIIEESRRSGRYHQHALERLIEIALQTGDDQDIKRWITAIEQIPTIARRPSLSYVRGKYAYFAGDYRAALDHFSKVPRQSHHARRADYLAATTRVAMGDLRGALAPYRELSRAPISNATQERIRDLSILSLGRLYYELDELELAAETYLRVPRRSELLPDALYELAWVHIKAADYIRALRALELLALHAPDRATQSKVRLLEANLRIRKAQLQYELRAGNPAEEYERANQIFDETRRSQAPSNQTLQQIIAKKDQASDFIAQIVASDPSFVVEVAGLPAAALEELRKQPTIARISTIVSGLEDARAAVDRSAALIHQLDDALSSPRRAELFPKLRDQRLRVLSIRSAVQKKQLQLLDLLGAADRTFFDASAQAQFDELGERRAFLVAALEKPTAHRSLGRKQTKVERRFTDLEKASAEISLLIKATEAEINALASYARTSTTREDSREEIRGRLEELRESLVEMRNLHAELRADVHRGMGATGRDNTADNVELDRRLRSVINGQAEIARAQLYRASVQQRRRIRPTLAALDRSLQLDKRSIASLAEIDRAADIALARTRTSLKEEHRQLAAFTAELAAEASASHRVGRTILNEALPRVAADIRDIVLKSEMGAIDVTWARKEGNAKLRARLLSSESINQKATDRELDDIIEELDKGRARLGASSRGRTKPPSSAR